METVMAGKKEKQTPKYQKLPEEVRRADILDAARTLFARKGYQGTRVDDVAARAGLTKGGVYFHFKNKQELFQAVINDRVEKLGSYLDDLSARRGDARQRLLYFFQLLLGEIEDNITRAGATKESYPGPLEIFLEGIKLQSGTGRVREMMRNCRRQLADLIREGQAQGMFGPVDPDAAGAAAVSLVQGFYLQLAIDPKAFDLKSTGRKLAEFFLSGLQCGKA
jgi:TetR/AcrR family acrAB operon transcriptional repressor